MFYLKNGSFNMRTVTKSFQFPGTLPLTGSKQIKQTPLNITTEAQRAKRKQIKARAKEEKQRCKLNFNLHYGVAGDGCWLAGNVQRECRTWHSLYSHSLTSSNRYFKRIFALNCFPAPLCCAPVFVISCSGSWSVNSHLHFLCIHTP